MNMSTTSYKQDILFPKSFRQEHIIVITSVFDFKSNRGHTNVIKYSLTNFHDNFTNKGILYSKDFANYTDMIKNHKRLKKKYQTNKKRGMIFSEY